MAKRYICRGVIFLLIFCVLFYAAQEVLRFKWANVEALEERYQDYLTEPEGSVDVLFIGSSTTYADVDPMIMWKDNGVTAINLGTSECNQLCYYYELQFALETQTPKLVMLDFHCLCADTDRRPYVGTGYEAAYRRVCELLPSLKLRYEMMRQITKDNPDQDLLSWVFPLLRYHSRWDELTIVDFDKSSYFPYSDYLKGALFWPYEGGDFEYRPGNMFETEVEPLPIDEYALGYYMKCIELCREKGIEIAAVNYPSGAAVEEKINLFQRYQAIEDFCDENGLNFYNLNTPEFWQMNDLHEDPDFYNIGHLNWRGSIKLTKALAGMLQEDYDLPDHRGDPAYSAWDGDWDAFYADHEAELAEFGY